MKHFAILASFLFSSILGMQPETRVTNNHADAETQMFFKSHTTAFAEQFARLESRNTETIEKNKTALAQQFEELASINTEKITKSNEALLSFLETRLAANKKEYEQKLAETHRANESNQQELQNQATKEKWVTAGAALVIGAVATTGMVYLCAKYGLLSPSDSVLNNKLQKLTDKVNEHDKQIKSNAGNIQNLQFHVGTLVRGSINHDIKIRVIDTRIKALEKKEYNPSREIDAAQPSAKPNEASENKTTHTPQTPEQKEPRIRRSDFDPKLSKHDKKKLKRFLLKPENRDLLDDWNRKEEQREKKHQK